MSNGWHWNLFTICPQRLRPRNVNLTYGKHVTQSNKGNHKYQSSDNVSVCLVADTVMQLQLIDIWPCSVTRLGISISALCYMQPAFSSPSDSCQQSDTVCLIQVSTPSGKEHCDVKVGLRTYKFWRCTVGHFCRSGSADIPESRTVDPHEVWQMSDGTLNTTSRRWPAGFSTALKWISPWFVRIRAADNTEMNN